MDHDAMDIGWKCRNEREGSTLTHLSRQQTLILEALRAHRDGCESDPKNCCMRWLNAVGYRYTERVRELRKKGFEIIAVRIGQGHFHYFLGKETPEIESPPVVEKPPLLPTTVPGPVGSACVQTAVSNGNPQLFDVLRIGELSLEVPAHRHSS